MPAHNQEYKEEVGAEFHARKPRDEPMETKGHQPGQLVGNDAVPTFHAKVLPAGTAPRSETFRPNPVDEVPGQADNPLANKMQDKENTTSDPLDFPGATSADVHTGLGHPGQGQTSNELRHDGAHKPGIDGQNLGGSGLTGAESVEARNLQKGHVGGPNNAREHNATLEGAESREPVTAEQLASEGRNVIQGDYDRTAEKPPGKHS